METTLTTPIKGKQVSSPVDAQSYNPHLPRKRRMLSLVLGAFVALGFVACQKEKAEPKQGEQTSASRVRDTPATEITPVSDLPRGAGTVPGNPTERASGLKGVGNNMGRDFEGRLRYNIRAGDRTTTLRYLSKGDRARLQVDSPGKNFDGLIADGKAYVLKNPERKFYETPLDDLKTKSESTSHIVADETKGRKVVAGSACDMWKIKDNDQQIETCVQALPGDFNLDKFEALSGFDAPAWLEHLVQENYFPVEATVRTAQGRELYRVELTEYSPNPVPDNELAVPSTYKKVQSPK